MQPYHAADDGRWAEKRIGRERCCGTYAFRALLDRGVVLAFGSDWTVAPLDPIQGIAAAVTRRTLDGKHPGAGSRNRKYPWKKRCALTRLARLRPSLPSGSKGPSRSGSWPIWWCYPRTCLRVASEAIEKIRVVLTVMDGRVVYAAADG